MQEAVALNEALANEAAPPDRSRTHRNLVIALWNLADMNRSLGRWKDGLDQAERGLAISRQEADRNPDDSGWTEMISLPQRALAGLYSGSGAHASAVRSADEVISALRRLRRISGANMGADLALAVGWKEVADAYQAADQSSTACSGLAEAHALLAGYEASGKLSE